MGYETIVLKPQQERFCQEFVLRGCCNATQAYLVAYPQVSEISARKAASRLLTNVDVRQRVREIQAEWKRRLEARVLGYHESVMSIDRRKLLSDGRCKPLEEWTEEEASILEFEQVSSKDGVRTLLKIPTRHQSAVELAKIGGMHKDNLALTGKDGGPVAVETSARPQLSREEWLAIHGIGGHEVSNGVDSAAGTATGRD